MRSMSHIKIMIAGPPERLRVEDKNVKAHYIPNLTGVIASICPTMTNRHFVAWSERRLLDFTNGNWNKLWNWYDHHGA